MTQELVYGRNERTVGSRSDRLRRARIKRAFGRAALYVCGIALAGFMVIQTYRIHDLPKAPAINGVAATVTYKNDICTTGCGFDTIMNIRQGFEADYSRVGHFLKVFYDFNHNVVMTGIGDGSKRYFMRVIDGEMFVEESKDEGRGWIPGDLWRGKDAEKRWKAVTAGYPQL